MKANEKIAEVKKRNLVVVDTSVLLADSEAISHIISEEGNLLIVSLTVLKELDVKKDSLGLSTLARLAINQIDNLIISNSNKLVLERAMDFEGLNLESEKHDFQILATLNYVVKSETYAGYQKYKLITLDNNMRLIAHTIFKDNPKISVEDYRANIIIPKKTKDMPIFPADSKEVAINYSEEVFGDVPENGGILFEYGVKDPNKPDANMLLALRKGERLELIPPDTEVFGLKAPYIHEGKERINFEQLLAFRHLTDKGVQCVFLQGQAGTGKTLLAIAAALHQRKDFEQIILVSPMIPLSNQTKMGFLPGDEKDKMKPWLMPFAQNIRYLEKKCKGLMEQARRSEPPARKSKGYDTDNTEENFSEKYGFIIQSLDYIRGQTIADSFIIIEEAQNLTQHDIKTIITRVGEGTKIVFCGDLSQIDLPYLNVRNSGMTYAIEKLMGPEHKNKMVAVSILRVTRRSKLAALASEVL